MSLTLGPGATGDKLAAKQDAGTDVAYEINGDLRTISGSTDAYGSLAQGTLTASAVALLGPASGTDMIVGSISLANPGASSRIVTFYKTKNSTTYDATTQWGPAITLAPGEAAQWQDGAWAVYNSAGQRKGIVLNELTTKGDLLTFDTAQQRLAVGLNRQALTANSAAATGLEYDDPIAVVHSTPAQALATTETYVTGSAIAVPAGFRAGGLFRWRIFISKTNAGTAAPVFAIKFGTAGAVGDTTRITITAQAQTAIVDIGEWVIEAQVTTAGASAIVVGMIRLYHQHGATGLSIGSGGETPVASSAFDLTVANTKAGVSITSGASAAWTVNRLITEVLNG